MTNFVFHLIFFFYKVLTKIFIQTEYPLLYCQALKCYSLKAKLLEKLILNYQFKIIQPSLSKCFYFNKLI